MFIPKEAELEKGKIYELKREFKNEIGVYRPPHNFIYMGVNGIGNYQDQYEFVDKDDRKIVFCPSIGQDWREYLRKL